MADAGAAELTRDQAIARLCLALRETGYTSANAALVLYTAGMTAADIERAAPLVRQHDAMQCAPTSTRPH